MKIRPLTHLPLAGRSSVILSTIFLLMLACSFPSRLITSTPTRPPTSTAAPTLTARVSPTPPASQADLSAAQPTAGGSAKCYLGTWDNHDLGDLITPILTAHKIQGLAYSGSSGSLALTFTPDGSFSIQSNNYHSIYTAQLGFLPVEIDVAIVGSGSGQYSVDASGNLLVTNPDFSGLTASATAASIQVIPPTHLSDLVPSLSSDLAGKTVNTGSTCSADSLSFDTGTSGVPPLVFTRTSQ